MLKECRIKNIKTGDIFYGKIDTELIGLESYPFVEIDEDEEIQEDIKKIQEWSNDEARKFLTDTDWQVIRHRDQLALGVETSITTEEFQQLLEERQQARERVYKIGVDVKNVAG